MDSNECVVVRVLQQAADIHGLTVSLPGQGRYPLPGPRSFHLHRDSPDTHRERASTGMRTRIRTAESGRYSSRPPSVRRIQRFLYWGRFFHGVSRFGYLMAAALMAVEAYCHGTAVVGWVDAVYVVDTPGFVS